MATAAPPPPRPEPARRPTEPASPPPAQRPPSPRRELPVVRLALLALLLAVGSVIGWRYFRTAADASADLTLYGNIDVRQVNLSFKVAGRIDTLRVDEGDPVKAGQPVATLDEVYFRDDLALAVAQRDQAKANYERLKNGSRPEEIDQARAAVGERQATLKRTEQDMKRLDSIRGNGASALELDQARAAVGEASARLKSAEASRALAEIGPRVEDIAAAKAQYSAAEAQVVVAERRLTDHTLIAPNDGVILTRARERGAVVNAGETVFALTLSSPVWVRTYVGEPNLGSVQPGQTVIVTTDVPGGRTYTGHVGFVSPTAEFTPKMVETRELRTDLVYRLRVVVDDPDGGLRQGMPVTVRVELPGRRSRSFQERFYEATWLDRMGVSAGDGHAR